MATRSSVVNKTIKDDDFSKLVNQMIGLEDPDPTIVVPRYRRIHAYATDILVLLEKFVNSPLGKTFGSTYPASFTDIMAFVHTSRDILAPLVLQENDKTFSGPELKNINADRSKVADLLTQTDEAYKIAGLGEKFNNLKGCSVVQNIIMLTRNIKGAVTMEKERRKSPKHDLEDKASLGDGFIVNSDGETLELFPYSKLNFKSMMNSDRMNPDLRQYTLYWLHLVYAKCLAIAEDVTSPPIDIERFAETMVESIGQLDGQIPRCKEAFNMIKNSVGMMKTNFRGYYRDFLSAGTPTVIVEHFLVDVAKGTKSNPKAAYQFRQIWKYYSQKMQAQNIKDPRVKKMLAMLGGNLDVLEEKKEPKKPSGSDINLSESLSGDNIAEDDSEEEPGQRKEVPVQLEGGAAPMDASVAPGKREKASGKVAAKPAAATKMATKPAAPNSPDPKSAAVAENPAALQPVLKKKAAKKR